MTWAEQRASDARQVARLQARKAAALEQRASAFPMGAGGGSGYYSGTSSPLPLQKAAQEGFRMSAVVYRCVMAIASPLAALDLGVLHGDSPEIDRQHPLAQLWNKLPNEHWTAYNLKLVAWMQCELGGQSFIYQDRGATAQEDIAGLYPIFYPMEIVVDDRTDPLRPKLLGMRAQTPAGVVPLLPSEVLWLRYPDPADPWGAMSPLRAASWAADLDNYARLWQAGEFRNGSAPSGVLYLGDVTDSQFEQIRTDFEARQAGPSNARRTVFTSGPVKPDYQRFGLSPVEMSYIQSREVNATDIRRAYGVPADLMDGAATYENQRNAKINLWTETLWGKLQVVESEIDRQQLPAPDLRAVFDVSKVDALRDNIDKIAERTQGNFKAGFILIDEARKATGYDELPDKAGQKLFVPRGAQNAEQAEVGALEPSGEMVPVAAGPPAPAAPATPAAPAAKPQTRATGPLVAAGMWALRRLAARQRDAVTTRQQRKRGEPFDDAYWEAETRAAIEPWLGQLYEPALPEQVPDAEAACSAQLEQLVPALVGEARAAFAAAAPDEAYDMLATRRAAAIARQVVEAYEGDTEVRAGQVPIHLHLHIDKGAIESHNHIDAGAVQVAPTQVDVHVPAPSKAVKLTGPDGKVTTVERSG